MILPKYLNQSKYSSKSMEERNELDLEKICRVCLASSGSVKDLFTVCTPEVFSYVTSVEVSKDPRSAIFHFISIGSLVPLT